MTGAAETALLALGIGAARTVPVAWMVPGLGGPRAGVEVRVGLGVALAALALPRVTVEVARAHLAHAGPALWALLIARELLVGATVGLVAAFAFRAAEAAGRIVDSARGASLAGGPEPAEAAGEGPLAQLYALLAILVFVELGGVGRLVAALARSYDAVPLALAGTVAGARGAALMVVLAAARLIEAAVALAAPVLVALLLADAAIAAMARLAPRVPIAAIAMPVRPLLAVGVVLVGLASLSAALGAGLSGWMALVDRALSAWR